MSHSIYTQVEDAIRRNLHCSIGKNWRDGPAWKRPIRIENGNIVMLRSDCGNENNPDDLSILTTDQWREAVTEDGKGLFMLIGMWSFVPADDPAADTIRWCHNYPTSAGRELYELLKLRDSLNQNTKEAKCS